MCRRVLFIVLFMSISSFINFSLGQERINKDETKQLIVDATKPIASQISKQYNIYKVVSDLDLAGETIVLPTGTEIFFDGGTISNGIIESDLIILNEWHFNNVIIKGYIDFCKPVIVPVNNPKGFIKTILEYKPDNSEQPTVFIFSSNQVYTWDGVLLIDKKNITLTGGGTIEGHIHLGMDKEKFQKLKYDKYSATSHANIIISNLRFSKYQIIGTSKNPETIYNYIKGAEPTTENIAISLVNSCHIKIEGCFFDNVPFPIVYTPNNDYVNQNVRRLNIVNCDFELCKIAVYAPSITNNSLEYGDLIFSNNNVHPTSIGLDLNCIDGLKVFNNTFSTCSKGEYGSNIRAYRSGQVVITNNSFYGEHNGEALILDSPGTCLIDANLFSSQGNKTPPITQDRIACIHIMRTSNTSYTSGLTITNNLFTKVDRLPIYADGYFRGVNIQGNLISGTQYSINKRVMYYYNSLYNYETHLQPLKMTDNILEDNTGTLELRMEVITDMLNANALYPNRFCKKNTTTYFIKNGKDLIPVKVVDIKKTKPIYVVSPISSSYSGDILFVFNGIQYSVKTSPQTSDVEFLRELIRSLTPVFGKTHQFKIIDNNLWIVGANDNIQVITPMTEINNETTPKRFEVIYQNLGYSITLKDIDGKNFIGIPLNKYGIDSNDDGKVVMFGNINTRLFTHKNNKTAKLLFDERPVLRGCFIWLYNDMFFACGEKGEALTNKVLSDIVELCYSEIVTVKNNSLVFKGINEEYNFCSGGGNWNSIYREHVVDYKFITDNGIEYDPINNKLNNFGLTSERPKEAIIGFQFFDTSIGRPVYWNGANWVDSDGNVR